MRAFPELTDNLIEKVVNMEYIVQSDFAWKEAPATAVLLAIEILKSDSFLPQPHQKLVAAMAKEAIYRYGNWRDKDLDIASSIRRECYQRNYEGDDWEAFYHEDGF